MSSPPLQLDSKTTATCEPRRASTDTPLTTVGKSLQRGFPGQLWTTEEISCLNAGIYTCVSSAFEAWGEKLPEPKWHTVTCEP